MSVILSLLRGISRGSAYLATLGLLGITVIISAEVISRYFLNSPLLWVGDTSRYLLSVGVFLALPEVSRRRGHPFMSLIIDAMNQTVRQPYQKILLIVAAFTCLTVAYFAVDIFLDQVARKTLTPGVVQIPRWILTATMIYGLVMTAIFFIFDYFSLLQENKKEALIND
jgi:TRAP-type C4-dicarboxylate transport system permease small subunit